MSDHKFITLGYVWTQGQWKLAESTKRNSHVASALDYLITNVLRYPKVIAVRLGHGIAKFPPLEHVERVILLWWNNNFEDCEHFEADGRSGISTSHIVGETWPDHWYLQLHFGITAHISFTDAISECSEHGSDAEASNVTDISKNRHR